MAVNGCLVALESLVAANEASHFCYFFTPLLKWTIGQILDMALTDPGKALAERRMS